MPQPNSDDNQKPMLRGFLMLKGAQVAVVGDANALTEAMKKHGIIASPRLESNTAPTPVLGESERKYVGAVNGRALVVTDAELKQYRDAHPESKIETSIKAPAPLEPLALTNALDVLKNAKADANAESNELKEGRDYASSDTVKAAKSLLHGPNVAALKNARWAMVRAPASMGADPHKRTDQKGAANG